MSGGSKTPNDTEQEKALAETAAQRFNLYQQHFVPLENLFVQEVRNLSTQAQYDRAASVAAAELAPHMADMEAQHKAEQFQRGVNPNSGAFLTPALQKAAAKGLAGGTDAAMQANTDRYYQGLSNFVAMGENQAVEAMQGIGDSARMAARQRMSADEERFNKRTARQNLVGGLAGAGTRVYMGDGG